MKVLFLNYEYPPLGGGAANATSCILREFSKIPDLKVDLVTSSYDNIYHLETIGQNIRIHKLPIGKNEKNIHFQSQKDLLVYSWRAYFFCQKLIRKNKYDLSHSFFSVPCGFISLLFKFQHKIPYIVSLRGADVPGFSERFSSFYYFLFPLIKIIWKNSKRVVSCSEGLKLLARKTKSDQPIDVITNGIDVDFFKPASEMKPEDKFIITLGGTRLTARKGIAYLLGAVAKLAEKHPEIYLKIIGDGNEKDNLERLSCELKIENKVEFLGQVPNREIVPRYQEASVFVLPSLNEGMSNALLEALSSGLPIVATDTGGTRELVDEGGNGFVIKMKDSRDIAEKIEKLIDNPKLREKMGQKSRKKAEELSWKKVADRYVALYEKTRYGK